MSPQQPTSKAIRLRVEVEQALARGEWSAERIADELGTTDDYVMRVKRDMDEMAGGGWSW